MCMPVLFAIYFMIWSLCYKGTVFNEKWLISTTEGSSAVVMKRMWWVQIWPLLLLGSTAGLGAIAGLLYLISLGV